MKETQLQSKEEIKLHAEKQIEKQTKLVFRMRPHYGHKCWQYNRDTQELSLAEFESQAIDFKAAANGEVALKRKIVVKDNCIYVTALNKKNALKHVNNQLKEKK